MKSFYFQEEHQLFRETLRDFFKKEVMPHVAEWEANRLVPRSIWEKMGEQRKNVCKGQA
ncbi:MAG: acyl-CoA dehydrogenase family protein [Microscillaceae bacterium]|jgi:alkylation response protein AidB-like acyl-CoA dehydrogenase|nr:acyl-CoA dehydrogenase family protein [Microscillaceae bacterium]